MVFTARPINQKSDTISQAKPTKEPLKECKCKLINGQGLGKEGEVCKRVMCVKEGKWQTLGWTSLMCVKRPR